MSAQSHHHHPEDARAHAVCANLRTMAYLLAAGLKPPDVRVTEKTVDEKSGWMVVTILAKYDGPPTLHLNAGVELEPMPLRVPLSDVQEAALKSAPAADAKPITVRALARLAGYGANSHFYEAVNVLTERGLLAKVRGKVRRA